MTRTSTTRTVAAAGALATVLSLAACGSQVAGSDGSLPLLRIGTSSYGATDVAAARVSGSGAAGSSQDPYPLTGTLPSGPSSAKVYRFSADATSSADVAALAKALGVDAAPVRHAHGWEVSSRSGDVRVHDGGTAWSYSRGTSECPSYAVDIDDADGTISSSGCAVAIPPGDILTLPGAASTGSGGGVTSGSASVVPCPGPTSPATPPPSCPATVGSSTTATSPVAGRPPTDSAAIAAAMPVLTAAGLDPAQARVLAGADGYPVRTVVLDPTVDGLRSSGDRTLVDVDRDGVLGALGVLATPTAGDIYPIVTAPAALDLLRAMPQPEIAIACVQGKVCPGIGPRPVTGAVLGLSMAYDGGAPVLVPAWLFTVTGSVEPVAVVAVERKYLADPTESPNPVGSGPDATSAPNPGTSDGGGTGSSPGSSGNSGPATPVPVTEPPVPGLSVQSVTLGKGGSTLVLGGVGGVCDDYAGKADETSTTVTVSIVATPKTPGGVCPAIAKEFSVMVTLSAPWDNRTIVDAASGATLKLG